MSIVVQHVSNVFIRYQFVSLNLSSTLLAVGMIAETMKLELQYGKPIFGACWRCGFKDFIG